MKLTKPMKEILLHRLEEGVIAGVLECSEICTETEAEEAEARVISAVNSGEIDLSKLTTVEWEVFKDALDGSTFFADSADAVALGPKGGGYTRGQLLTWHKAANALEAACRAERGSDVTIPRN